MEEMKILKLVELVVCHMDPLHPNHLSRECFPRREIRGSFGSTDTEETKILKLMELVVCMAYGPSSSQPLLRLFSARSIPWIICIDCQGRNEDLKAHGFRSMAYGPSSSQPPLPRMFSPRNNPWVIWIDRHEEIKIL